MRQLEFSNTKSVRRRKTQTAITPVTLALKDDEVRELVQLMAQAIIAVAENRKEAGDER